MKQMTLVNDLNKIQKLFSGRLYQDKYTFIQEIVSNAKDSHTRANQTKPVEVKLYYKEFDPTNSTFPIYSSLTFEVRDYGTGLDKDEFDLKIGQLAYSDKEDNLQEIGRMGIGSISWAAYNNECTFTCIKDGKKFVANMKEDDNDGISYDLSEYEDTFEPNGVLFSINVGCKEGVSAFTGKIRQKLAYFSNVWFEICNDVRMNSEMEIIRTDHFQISTLHKDDEMHLTLDDVVYPINWSKLGIPPIYEKLALRFAAKEGLEPTITRESIRYTDHVVELIMNKLKASIEWLVNRWNETCADADILTCIKNYNMAKLVRLANHNIKIDYLANLFDGYEVKEPGIKGINSSLLKKFFKNFDYWSKTNLNIIGYTDTYRMSKTVYGNISLNMPVNSSYYLVKDKVDRKRLSALKKSLSGIYNTAYLVKLKSRSLKRYIANLNLKSTEKNLWRSKIKDFQEIEDLYIKEMFKPFEDIEIPEVEKIKTKTTSVRRTRTSEEITVYEIRHSSVRNKTATNLKTVNLGNLYKEPYFHIFHTERSTLDKIFRLQKSNFKQWLVSERNYAKIKKLNLHNFMTADDFLKGESNILSKCVTGYLINNYISKNPKLFSNVDVLETYVDEEIIAKIKELIQYGKKYSIGYIWDDSFRNSIVELIEKTNTYDFSIWHTFKAVESELDKYSFVQFLSHPLRNTILARQQEKEEAKAAFIDICKYRRIKTKKV